MTAARPAAAPRPTSTTARPDSMSASGATSAGRSSGAQNATATSRRCRRLGPEHVAQRRAGGSRGGERQQHGQRDVARRAGEIADGLPQRTALGADVQIARVGERREIVAARARRHGARATTAPTAIVTHGAADRKYGPRRGSSSAARPSPAKRKIDQYLPSIAAAAHAPASAAQPRASSLERAQKAQSRRAPQRHQHGVGIELQRVEIEERHQRQQRQSPARASRRRDSPPPAARRTTARSPASSSPADRTTNRKSGTAPYHARTTQAASGGCFG